MARYRQVLTGLRTKGGVSKEKTGVAAVLN